MMHDPRQRLIVALDVSSAAAAQKIVAAVGDSASCYKVGMQLYTAEGPQVVRDLVAPDAASSSISNITTYPTPWRRLSAKQQVWG